MKITRIESVTFSRLPRLLFVRVHTDAGIVGIGETYDKAPGSLGALHGTIAPVMLGSDPRDIDRLWRICFDSILYHGFAGAELRALSAVELALWDILGKSLKTPVYKLLGGAVRPSVSTYNTCLCHEPNRDYQRWRYDGDAGQMAMEMMAQGITGVKIWPFDRFTEWSHGNSISKAEIDEALEPIRDIRRAVGDDFKIGIEMHFRWRRAAAEQIAYALEPYNIYFIEDPMPAVNVAEMKRLSQAIKIPVVGSETLLSRWQIRDWITESAAQVLNTDVVWTGGIAEAKRIAPMAEAFGLPIMYHNAGGPIAHMASLHVAANTPNLFELESIRGFYQTYFKDLTDIDVQINNGQLALPPYRPGLGIEFLPSVWERDDISRQVTQSEGDAARIYALGDFTRPTRRREEQQSESKQFPH